MNAQIRPVLSTLGQIVLGKETQLKLTIACLLARGHLLIEDLPGVGKTTLAHALARTLGLQFQRVQFTSDLLPADILGASVYDRDTGSFTFHPGPVFTQVVLADEVNRATPKAQSALLEAMEEQQVTIDGQTRSLPEPFFVIATQNPSFHVGTFPLPESQLDRFLMRIELGFPDPAAERALLAGQERRTLIHDLAPVLTPAALVALQGEVRQVHTAAALLDYVQDLLTHSRRAPEFGAGLSPRAGLALLNAARAWAFMHGRGAVLPEDVQAVLPSVVGHRLHAPGMAPQFGSTDLGRKLAAEVAIP
jgi:MoxR-like ATPase